MDDQYTCSECGKPAVVDHKSPPIRLCGCSKGNVIVNMQAKMLRPTVQAFAIRNQTYLRTGMQIIGAACLLGEKGVRDEAYDYLLCFGCELLLKYRILLENDTKKVDGIKTHSLTKLYALTNGNDKDVVELMKRANMIYCNEKQTNKYPIRYADTISFIYTRLSDDDRDSLLKYAKTLI